MPPSGDDAAPSPALAEIPATARRDLWIFGYGSLMWRPGFAYVRAVHARLDGYKRCFCLYSMHHRGTIHRPGLVLGLDRGGTCEGIAYLVEPSSAHAVHAYLTEREQVSGAYREAWLPIHLQDESRAQVMGLAYLVEREHPNFAGRLPISTQAHLIRGARGVSGPNIEYLLNTVAHLLELGIRERELERLVGLVGAHLAESRRVDSVRLGVGGIMTAVRRLPFAAPRLRPFERKRFVHRRRLAAVSI
jgi:cation transport protein ChaC